MKKTNLSRGATSDAILLMLIRLVTILLSFVITRLLSEYLSVYDYGTYSQILLIVTTVTSVTILGMTDGINYFYCSEQDPWKRESYVSTIFAMQCTVSGLAGSLVLLLSGPLCAYFDNPDVGGLLIFGAALPLLQNLLSLFQVLLVSVGLARVLAVRNLVVSVIRLAVVILMITWVGEVAVILTTTLLLDVVQIAFFALILRKNRCAVSFKSIRPQLVRQILRYCAPMAVFTVIRTLNRDIDKYLVTVWTDTQTLAVYANASKVLPFDIILTSFCTVLQPQVTQLMALGEQKKIVGIYKGFLEIMYVSTGILCCAALAASPQLIELLYSKKYVSGLTVFCIYILVDLLQFSNITMLQSAAGKTKALTYVAVGALATNAALNVVFFRWLGLPGPALATLLTTLGMGIWLLRSGAKELESSIRNLFDWSFLPVFAVESLAAVVLLFQVQRWLADMGVHYFVILVLICGSYVGIMLLLHGKRLLRGLKQINQATKKSE